MSLHHHHHHHHHKEHAGTRNVATAFFINLAFTFIELGGGWYTNSMAILSDALHDFGDSLALGMAWYFEKLSTKKANQSFTYGYGRFTVLGAFINALILIGGSVFIFIHAIPRLSQPEEVFAPGMTVLAVLGILFNGAAILKLNRKGSLNERVIYLHLLEDVLGWLLVLVSSFAIYFFGWVILDPILSMVIGVYIIFNALQNLKESVRIFLQQSPKQFNLEQIRQDLLQFKEIEDVHDLHIWGMDTENIIMSMHCKLNSEGYNLQELKGIKEQIVDKLFVLGINHATIEFESPHESCINQEDHDLAE